MKQNRENQSGSLRRIAKLINFKLYGPRKKERRLKMLKYEVKVEQLPSVLQKQNGL